MVISAIGFFLGVYESIEIDMDHYNLSAADVINLMKKVSILTSDTIVNGSYKAALCYLFFSPLHPAKII